MNDLASRRLRLGSTRSCIKGGLLILSAMVCGCTASTRFIPPNDGRVYLVMMKSQFGVCRDGLSIPLSKDPRQLFSKNTQALAFAAGARESYRRGETESTAAGCLYLLAPIFCIPLQIDSIRNYNRAGACLIDAINAENDLRPCPPEGGRP